MARASYIWIVEDAGRRCPLIRGAFTVKREAKAFLRQQACLQGWFVTRVYDGGSWMARGGPSPHEVYPAAKFLED